MPHPSTPRNIVTQKSLQSTVLRDPQTLYWFSRMLAADRLKGVFISDKALEQKRMLLKYIILCESLVFFLVLPILILESASYRQLTTLIAIWGFVLLLLMLGEAKRRITSGLSYPWVRQEFKEEELAVMTLYQLAERLGKKYALPTLVDTIAHWDWTIRRWVAMAYLATICILYWNLFNSLLLSLTVFVMIVAFLRYRSLSAAN